MKILHITATHLNPTGGVVVVLKNLTDAQNKLDDVESIVLSINAKVDNIDSSYFYYLGSEKILTFIKEHKPDLAIIHSFFHSEYTEVAHVLIKEGIPFYIEPHGSFGYEAMKKSRIKKMIANNTVFRKQVKESKGYIFTNKSELDDSIYKTPNDLVIPNGVLPSVIHNSSMKTEESLRDPVFYFLGRFDIYHKGLDYLLDALDILERNEYTFKVNLYGTGTDEQINFVENRIKNYKKMNVKNCGTIYGDEKKKALESCNILLLTSRYEGSPMTVLDGFSYGNPCIVTPGTNVSEEASANSIGWRTELDASIIAKTIIEAYEMYIDDGCGFFVRCKNYVLDHYSWDEIAKYSVDKLRKQLNK